MEIECLFLSTMTCSCALTAADVNTSVSPSIVSTAPSVTDVLALMRDSLSEGLKSSSHLAKAWGCSYITFDAGIIRDTESIIIGEVADGSGQKA